MAQTFTATANSNTTIGYALYGSSSWSKGSSNGACQGAYQKTSASGSRVGVMLFSGAGTALKGKIIRNIVFSITSSKAGSGSTSKVLTFRKGTQQTFPTGGNGSAMVGDVLGTLTGKFYGNTTTFTLNASSKEPLINHRYFITIDKSVRESSLSRAFSGFGFPVIRS